MESRILIAGKAIHLFHIIGFILIGIGGIIYGVIGTYFWFLASVLIVTGVILFLLPSKSFQIKEPKKIILILILANLLLIVVDFWPLQLLFAYSVSSLLGFWGIAATEAFVAHFASLWIGVFVPEFGTGVLIGGEIDNACAGAVVIIPALLLLILNRRGNNTPWADFSVGIFLTSLVIGGNFLRIFLELFLPAIGLAPFSLVHYPLAFLFGISGVGMIGWIGNQWSTEFKQKKAQDESF